MPTLLWAIPCTQVLTDKRTNATTYVNAVEGLNLPSFPSETPPLTMGTTWTRSRPGEKFRLKLEVEDPEGNVVHSRELEERSFGDYKRFRVNILFSFLCKAPGTYRLLVSYSTKEKFRKGTSIPFDIVESQDDKVSSS